MKKSGFTLAEVLITLVIIGIIASITIPALMNNVEGEENIVAYKKALSVMNQAINTEYALEGNTPVYTTKPISGLPEKAKNWRGLAAIMAKRTNIINYNVGSFGEQTTTSAGTTANIFATADGMIYAIPNPHSDYTSCPVNGNCFWDDCSDSYAIPCGQAWVDVNGKKGPNKIVQHASSRGKRNKVNDRFHFVIYETTVLPGLIPNSVEAKLIQGVKKK